MSKLKAVSPDAATLREETIRALVDGSKRFHEIQDDYLATEAAAIRREALERICGVRLDAIGHHSFDTTRAAERNCENMIGVAQIPMGIVGPLTVPRRAHRRRRLGADGRRPKGRSSPASTAAARRSGSRAARRHVDDVGMTRAPVFRAKSHRETAGLPPWVKSTTTRSARRLRDQPIPRADRSAAVHVRTSIFLRFRFTTGDAMGMNMATIACDRIVRDLIEPQTAFPAWPCRGTTASTRKPPRSTSPRDAASGSMPRSSSTRRP
jgi:hydroxymethylglutaryl-CoA reductase (NADPH)